MTTGSPWQKILIFTLPMLLGNIAQQLYNTVDAAVIGHFGPENALGAVTSTGSIVNMMIGIVSQSFTTAGSTMVGQNLGAQKYDRVPKIMRTVLTCGMIISTAFALALAFFSESIFAMFTPATAEPVAESAEEEIIEEPMVHTVATTPHTYKTIHNAEELRTLCDKLMTYKEICEKLRESGIDNYGYDAAVLIEELEGTDVATLRGDPNRDYCSEKLMDAIDKRCKHYPLQYIIGEWEFFGKKFEVSESCLIPRADTETLVETAIKLLPRNAYFADLCTGSGCIAISLALAGFQTTAMDISEDALAVATDNASQLGAEVLFVHENILHPSPTGAQWDVIVSNPPYVCLHEAEDMERNVLDYEPHQAVFVPDTDPLIFYRAIASYALSHLAPGGWLCLEINQAYSKEMTGLLCSFGFRDVTIIQDQYGKDRIACAHL